MKRKALAAIIALCVVTLAACGSDPTKTTGGSGGSSDTITIGSANFPENELLAEMYAQAIEGAGGTVNRKFNIGSREAYWKALQDKSIDLLPEYNGALLAFLLGADGIPQDVTTPTQVTDALNKKLPSGIVSLDPSTAEDKDMLSVTESTAKKYNLKSITDLKSVAGQLIIGGSPEFQQRYQGLLGLKSVYGLDFKSYKPLDAGGPLTVGALKDGTIDIADIFSTDSSIKTDKFVTLDDPKNLFTAQNILPIIRKEKASDKVKAALNSVSKALTTKNLTDYLAEVQVDKKDSKTVAKEFIEKYKIK
ncbi:MAG: ABC transporter substrate-binding protein [Antricoccus sp.]